MKFEDLIDIEYTFIKDEARDPEEIYNRDRKIAEQIKVEDFSNKEKAINKWLEHIKIAGNPEYGKKIAESLVWLRKLILFVGLLLGISCTIGVLSQKPVDILLFLALFVGFQFLLLLFLVITMSYRNKNSFNSSIILSILRSALFWKFKKYVLNNNNSDSILEDYTRLSSVNSRYERIEKYFLFKVSQLFAIAFNMGAVFTFIYYVSFIGITFGWDSNSINSNQLNSFTSVISVPFKIMPFFKAPDIEMIEYSKYSRMEKKYHKSVAGKIGDTEQVRNWWLFLFCSMILYGFFPRVFAFIVINYKLKKSLKKVSYNSPDFITLFSRLKSIKAEFKAEESSNESLNRNLQLNEELKTEKKVSGNKNRCFCIIWNEIILDKDDIKSRTVDAFGWEIDTFYEAGGGINPDSDRKTIKSLLGKSNPVLIIAASYDAPDIETKRFLQEIRNSIKKDTTIAVWIMDNSSKELKQAAKTDYQAWNHSLSTLQDPYLYCYNSLV